MEIMILLSLLFIILLANIEIEKRGGTGMIICH